MLLIISRAQNSEPDVERFEYSKAKQDDLIDYFKLTPTQWEDWNRERHGDDRCRLRPPLKILIVCDRLLTGFNAPVEQVMYLDKPLRDHNLLQAIARTNRPLPSMKKRTGIVVDYFGVFADFEKALNFDENGREESLIDWDRLRDMVLGEVARCLETFEGIAIADTRECLLSALRRLREVEAAKTKALIEENTSFVVMAQSLPVLKIGQDYAGTLDALPTPADKAAALEAMLTAELAEGDAGFIYRLLGERLQKIKEQQEAGDEATAKRLRELEEIAGEAAAVKQEPDRRPHSTRRVRAVHDPARPYHRYGRNLHRGLFAAHDPPLEPASAPGDGVEQLRRRAHAGRAVAVGGVLESQLSAARLRSGCGGPAVPQTGGGGTGQVGRDG